MSTWYVCNVHIFSNPNSCACVHACARVCVLAAYRTQYLLYPTTELLSSMYFVAPNFNIIRNS